MITAKQLIVFEQTADSGTVLTNWVFSVQLVTEEKLEVLNNA